MTDRTVAHWSPPWPRARAIAGWRLFAGTISKAQILHETTLAARVLRSRSPALTWLVPQPLNSLSGTCRVHRVRTRRRVRPTDPKGRPRALYSACCRCTTMAVAHRGLRKPLSFHVVMASAPWVCRAACEANLACPQTTFPCRTLHHCRHVGRTHLERPGHPGMCEAPAPPQFPSRGCGTISGTRIQKRPLTHPWDVGSRFGTVSDSG